MKNPTPHPPATEALEASVLIEAAAVILAHAILDGSVYPLDRETCAHVLTLIDRAGRRLARVAA